MDSLAIVRKHGRISRQNYDFAIAGNGGKFVVPQVNTGVFMVDYIRALKTSISSYYCPEPEASEDENRALGLITVKPSATMPVVIDMNLRYTDRPHEPYDDQFICYIVRGIQQAVVETFEVDDSATGQDLICVVTEWNKPILMRDDRPGYQSCYLYKIRFHFPYCRVESGIMTRLIPVVSTNLRSVNAFSCLSQSPIGDWDSILKPFITEPMALYGSSEKPKHPMLSFSGIYPSMTHCDDEDITAVDMYTIDEAFALENHSMIRTEIYDINLFDEELTSEDLLPLFLSIDYCPNVAKTREHVNPAVTPNGREEVPHNFGAGYNFPMEKTNHDICQELLPLISAQRYSNKLSWIDIGRALANTYDGSQEGLVIWVNETERAIKGARALPDFLSDGSVNDICFQYYDTFEIKKDTTVKTIAWYAKEDNPDVYKRWHREWITPYMESALDCTHDSLSKALYCHLWLIYACSSPSQKTIYEYRGNRWVKIDGGYTIRLYISNEFKRSFEEIRAKISAQIATSNDAGYKAKAEDTMLALSKVIKMLGNRGFKNQVMLDLVDRIVVEDFEEFVDSNPNITGHPNGITEVSYADAIIKFRQGKPEDYVSRTTLAKLNLDLHWKHPLVIALMNWLGKMFVNNETRQWVIIYLSSAFIAGNLDKLLAFFSGDKDNGKSTLSRLLMKTWGVYAVKFPCSGLTRGYSDSGAPNPAWARLDRARWAFADEMDEDEHLRNGPCKLVSGNDPFFNRKLFKDGGDIEPTATVASFTNRVPPFRGADEAVKERFVLIPCLSTWMKTGYPETEEEQYAQRRFPMEKDFINQVRFLNTAMLWVSYQFFPLWAQSGLDTKPAEIEEATQSYWMENDIYLMYTSDRVEEGNDMDYLTVTQVYNDFETWFNKFNKGQTVPERATMRYHLIQRWGPVTNNTWWGVKHVENDAEQVNGANVEVVNQVGMKKVPHQGNLPGVTQDEILKTVVPQRNPTGTTGNELTNKGKTIPAGGALIKPLPTADLPIMDNLGLPTIEEAYTPNQQGITVEIVDGKIVTKKNIGVSPPNIPAIGTIPN